MAYKWHSFVPPILTLRNQRGQVIPAAANVDNIAQFQNTQLIRTYGIEPVLIGLANQPAGTIRFHNLPPGMQNNAHPYLVSYPINPFGQPTCQVVPAFDFATVDITRDRERGIPKYNKFRQLVTAGQLAGASYFDDITENAADAQTLADLYLGDINNVDAIVGIHGEKMYSGQGFPLTMVTAFLPFVLARAALDRFYHDSMNTQTYTAFGLSRVACIDFAQVLCDNGVTCSIFDRTSTFLLTGWKTTQMEAGTQTIFPTVPNPYVGVANPLAGHAYCATPSGQFTDLTTIAEYLANPNSPNFPIT